MKYVLLQMLTPMKLSTNSTTRQDSTTCEICWKKKKAADPYGKCAEHLKCTDASIIPILTLLINFIYKKQSISDDFKLGFITPIIKKQKPKVNSNNYQRITVN